MTIKQAYQTGLADGYEHAAYCCLSQAEYIQAEQDDTLGEILSEIVESFRQYSPFEFTAAELNKARHSEAQWEAYDKGEYEGFIEGLTKRFH